MNRLRFRGIRPELEDVKKQLVVRITAITGVTELEIEPVVGDFGDVVDEAVEEARYCLRQFRSAMDAGDGTDAVQCLVNAARMVGVAEGRLGAEGRGVSQDDLESVEADGE